MLGKLLNTLTFSHLYSYVWQTSLYQIFATHIMCDEPIFNIYKNKHLQIYCLMIWLL